MEISSAEVTENNFKIWKRMYEYKSLNMTFPPVAVMGGDKDTYLEEGEDGESNPSSQMLIPLLKLAQCFQSGK